MGLTGLAVGRRRGRGCWTAEHHQARSPEGTDSLTPFGMGSEVALAGAVELQRTAAKDQARRLSVAGAYFA